MNPIACRSRIRGGPSGSRSRRSGWLGAVAGVTVMLAGCQREAREAVNPVTGPGEAMVAQVGQVQLGEAAFAALLERYCQTRAIAVPSAADKDQVLAEWILAESILHRARAEGFEQRPDVAQAIRRLIIARYQEEHDRQVPPAGSAPIPDAAVSAFYREQASQFGLPPAVRGEIIFLAVDRKAPAARREARRMEAEALRQQVAQRGFHQLAIQHSEDQATRYQGGATGWLTKDPASGAADPALVQAMFDCREPGELAPVVEGAGGFYVARLVEKRPAGVRPLAEVRPLIEHRLRQEEARKRDGEFRTAMREGLDIRVDREAMDRVRLPAQPDAPPRTPGARIAGMDR